MTPKYEADVHYGWGSLEDMPSDATTELFAEDGFPNVAVDAVTVIRPGIRYLLGSIRMVFLVVLHLELR